MCGRVVCVAGWCVWQGGVCGRVVCVDYVGRVVCN